MPVTRAHTSFALAVCVLLLGGACSSSSESTGDRGAVVDAPVAGETEGGDSGGADGPVASETEGGDSGVACTGEYSACECGCCDGGLAQAACYFPSRGDTVATAESYDRAMAQPNSTCNFAGCIRYVCCPALPAEDTSAAGYSAEWIPLGGGMSGLQIAKKGADCASILTYEPGENYTGIRTSEINWGLLIGSVGACGDGGAGQAGIGGIGTLTFSPKRKSCAATQFSLHATVFGLTADGSVQAVRMDVDNLLVNPSPSCP